METWFTSDTHFAHSNLCKGATNWIDDSECRNFESVHEMDTVLVDAINKNVKENDTLYHLGDWAFGSFDNIANFRRRIHCKHIHLVLGNHDKDIARNRGGARGNFTSIHDILDIRIGDDNIVLCHYAMRVWNKCHRGSWNLHGHSHGRLPAYVGFSPEDDSKGNTKHKMVEYKQMDVGVDTNKEFRPYSYEELKKIMDKRSSNFEDLHGR